MADPTLVQEVSLVFGSPASPATKAFASNVTAGNILLLTVGTNSGESVSGVTDTLGNTWVKARSQDSTGHSNAEVWYTTTTTSGTDTLSIARTGGGTYNGVGGHLMEWTNIASLATTQVAQNTGSAPVVCPNFTGLATNDLVLYWAEHTNNNTPTGGIWTDTARDILTSGGLSYFQATYAVTGGNVSGPTLIPGTSSDFNIIGVAFSVTPPPTGLPARLQSWNASQAFGVTQVTGTAGSNMTAGSTMICLVSMGVNPTETVTSVVDNLGNNFWKVIETPFNAYGLISLWALNTPSAQVGQKPTLTATKSGGGWVLSFLCQEVSHLPLATTLAALCDGTPLYDYAPFSVPSSPTNDVPYSSSIAGEYTISCYTDPSESGHPTVISTAMAAFGWTQDANCIQANGSTGNSCCIAYKSSIGGLEAPNTWTIPSGNPEDWNQLVVSFKAVQAGYVQSKSQTGRSSTTVATTLPAAITAGNLLIADVYFHWASQTVSISDGHNTWIPIGSPQQGVGAAATLGIQQFYAKNVAAGSYAITATSSLSVSILDIAVTEVGGRDRTSPLNSHAYSLPTGSTSITSASITTTQDGCYIHACVGMDSTAVSGVNAPFTQRESANWDGNSVADYSQPTAAAISATWTATGPNANQIAGIVAFAPPGIDATVAPASVACRAAVPAPTMAIISGATITAVTITARTAVPAPLPHGNIAFPPSIVGITAVPPITGRISDNLAPIAIHSATVVPSPSIAAGGNVSATVNAVAIHAVTAMPAPALAFGVTTFPPAIQAVTAVPVQALSTSSTLTPSSIHGVTQQPVALVLTGTSATAAPATITATTVAPSPTLLYGQVLSPPTITAVVGVPSLRAEIGVALVPPAITAPAALPAPATAVSVSAQVTPPAITALTALPAPARAAGAIATPASIAMPSAVPGVALTRGTMVSPIPIFGFTAMPVVSLSTASNVTISPSSILAAVTAIPTPTLTTVLALPPPAVAARTAVPAPLIGAGSTVSPVSISGHTSMDAPSLATSGNVSLSPLPIACRTAVSAPQLTIPATLQQTAPGQVTVSGPQGGVDTSVSIPGLPGNVHVSGATGTIGAGATIPGTLGHVTVFGSTGQVAAGAAPIGTPGQVLVVGHGGFVDSDGGGAVITCNPGVVHVVGALGAVVADVTFTTLGEHMVIDNPYLDDSLAGATGYTDDVFTARSSGPTP